MKNFMISQDQLNTLLLNFTSWNGSIGIYRIVKEENFNLDKYPFHQEVFDNEDHENEFRKINGQCEEGKIAVWDYKLASIQEIKTFLNRKIKEYENKKKDDDEFYYDSEFQNLILLKEIVKNKLV